MLVTGAAHLLDADGFDVAGQSELAKIRARLRRQRKGPHVLARESHGGFDDGHLRAEHVAAQMTALIVEEMSTARA